MNFDFIPYPCSLGEVINHADALYVIMTPDGRTIGISANSQPSRDLVEFDIANPPIAATPVPAEVAMWSIRAILDIAGLASSIDSVLARLPEPDRTIVGRAWEYGNYIRRDSPTIASLALALGKTSAEVDEYFIAASNLNP